MSRAAGQAVSTVWRMASGPSAISRGTIGGGHEAITTSTPCARSAATSDAADRVVGDERRDLRDVEDEGRGHRAELGRVREDDAVARRAAQRPVGEDLGDRVVHQAEIGPDRADAHVERVGAQLTKGELGDVAQRRVHARPDDAAEHDELDAGPVHQDRRHVEGVRDDRDPPVDEPTGEFEGRRSARDEDRVAVLDPSGGGLGDGPLRGETGVAGTRERGTAEGGAAVRPQDAAVTGQASQVAADRRGRDAEIARERADRRPAVGSDPGQEGITSRRA